MSNYEKIQGIDKHPELFRFLKMTDKRLSEEDGQEDAAVNMRRAVEYMVEQYLRCHSDICGNNLFEKINALSEAKIISGKLTDAFHTIRSKANTIGAHYDADKDDGIEEVSINEEEIDGLLSSLYTELISATTLFLRDIPEYVRKTTKTNGLLKVDRKKVKPLLITRDPKEVVKIINAMAICKDGAHDFVYAPVFDPPMYYGDTRYDFSVIEDVRDLPYIKRDDKRNFLIDLPKMVDDITKRFNSWLDQKDDEGWGKYIVIPTLLQDAFGCSSIDFDKYGDPTFEEIPKLGKAHRNYQQRYIIAQNTFRSDVIEYPSNITKCEPIIRPLAIKVRDRNEWSKTRGQLIDVQFPIVATRLVVPEGADLTDIHEILTRFPKGTKVFYDTEFKKPVDISKIPKPKPVEQKKVEAKKTAPTAKTQVSNTVPATNKPVNKTLNTGTVAKANTSTNTPHSAYLEETKLVVSRERTNLLQTIANGCAGIEEEVLKEFLSRVEYHHKWVTGGSYITDLQLSDIRFYYGYLTVTSSFEKGKAFNTEEQVSQRRKYCLYKSDMVEFFNKGMSNNYMSKIKAQYVEDLKYIQGNEFKIDLSNDVDKTKIQKLSELRKKYGFETDYNDDYVVARVKTRESIISKKRYFGLVNDMLIFVGKKKDEAEARLEKMQAEVGPGVFAKLSSMSVLNAQKKEVKNIRRDYDLLENTLQTALYNSPEMQKLLEKLIAQYKFVVRY